MVSKSGKQPIAPHEWRAKLGRKKTDPLSEITVRKLLADPSLRDGVWFQKGNSPYRSAEEVSELFRRLDRDGFYLKNKDVVEGPYTPEMLFKRLNEVGPGASDLLGWRGADGTWLGVKEIIKAFDDTHAENTIAAQKLLLDKKVDSDTSDSASKSSSLSFGPSFLETMELGDQGISADAGATGWVEAFMKPDYLSITKESEREPNSKASDSLATGLDVGNEKNISSSSGEGELFSSHWHLDNIPSEIASVGTSSSGRRSSERKMAVAEQPRRRKTRTGGKRGLLCLDCGKKINLKTGICDYCR